MLCVNYKSENILKALKRNLLFPRFGIAGIPAIAAIGSRFALILKFVDIVAMPAIVLKGRYRELTEKEQIHIIKAVESGLSVTAACVPLGISLSMVYDFELTHPPFANYLKKAREIRTHNDVEMLRTIADDAVTLADVHRCKVTSDNIKWIAGKYIPNLYGENVNVNVNHTLDLSAILLAAENRVLPILAAKREISDSKQDSLNKQNLVIDADFTKASEVSEIAETAKASQPSTISEIPDELLDLI